MLLMQNAFTRGKTTILPTPHPLIPPAAFPNQKFRSEWFKKKKKGISPATIVPPLLLCLQGTILSGSDQCTFASAHSDLKASFKFVSNLEESAREQKGQSIFLA